VQHVSLFSQLQLSGSFRQDGHMMIPHPTQVLLNLLQPQCLHSFIQQFYHCYIITLRSTSYTISDVVYMKN